MWGERLRRAIEGLAYALPLIGHARAMRSRSCVRKRDHVPSAGRDRTASMILADIR
jgi:hypothetical protein